MKTKNVKKVVYYCIKCGLTFIDNKDAEIDKCKNCECSNTIVIKKDLEVR